MNTASGAARAATRVGRAAGSARTARCIRCGHDLRGETSRWTDACPLRGRCPECGLEFRWWEVCSPAAHYPWWSVEGGRTPLGWCGRWLGTALVAMAMPWLPARSLTMRHPVRGRRLAAAAAIWLLVGYAGLVLGVRGALLDRWSNTELRGTVEPPRGPIMAWSLRPWSPSPVPLIVSDFGAATWIETSDGWLSLPLDLAPWFDDPADVELLFDPQAGYFAEGARMGANRTPAGALGDADRKAVVERIVSLIEADDVTERAVPWPERRGMVMLGPTVSKEHRERLGPVRARIAWTEPVSVYGWRVIRSRMTVFVVGGAFVVLGVAAFAGLPIARRRARVQWRHIGRVGAYLLLGAIPAGLVLDAVVPEGAMAGLVYPRAEDAWSFRAVSVIGLPVHWTGFVVGSVLVLALSVLVAALWTAAAAWYLRMERPWAVGAAVGAVGGVVAWFATLALV